MKILEINDLSKSYDGKKNVLKDCSFSIESGKICAIVGESGSGKSTLLKLITGLERPSAGQIKIKGKVVSNDDIIVSPQQRNVGLVFQDFALFPHLTVKENISFGLKKDKTKKVDELLKKIKMEGYGNRYPSELSGGQEQRVSIARTLALNPELLLLDEPFSSLDTNLKSDLRQEIKQIIKDIGQSMIFITHDIFDALDIADEIIFLKEGNIIRHSSIKNAYKDVENEYLKKSMKELKSNAERILKAVNNK
jgi:iron(III) transport system ATP-binding protein